MNRPIVVVGDKKAEITSSKEEVLHASAMCDVYEHHSYLQSATSYNQTMDAKLAMKRHEQEVKEGGAGNSMAEGDNRRLPVTDSVGGGDSRASHPTIAAALGFGPGASKPLPPASGSGSAPSSSPSKDGRRFPCTECSSTFTRYVLQSLPHGWLTPRILVVSQGSVPTSTQSCFAREIFNCIGSVLCCRVDNMRAHMLKFHGIEVPPSGGNSSRRSTPVSLVPGGTQAGDAAGHVMMSGGIYDSPSMVPRHLGSALSPGATANPIVIQPLAPDQSEKVKVSIFCSAQLKAESHVVVLGQTLRCSMARL